MALAAPGKLSLNSGDATTVCLRGNPLRRLTCKLQMAMIVCLAALNRYKSPLPTQARASDEEAPSEANVEAQRRVIFESTDTEDSVEEQEEEEGSSGETGKVSVQSGSASGDAARVGGRPCVACTC